MIWTIRRRLVTVFGVAVLGYSSTIIWDAQAQKPTGETANTNRLPERTTILTGASAQPLFKQHSRRSPAAIAFWTPTPTDVRAAEKALQLSAPTFKMRYGPNFFMSFAAKRLQSNYRQYAGFVDKYTGHNCLYINGFKPDKYDEAIDRASPGQKQPRWKKKPVVVFDGGTGYWGVEYDTQTGKWLHFSFNGR